VGDENNLITAKDPQGMGQSPSAPLDLFEPQHANGTLR